MAGERGPLPKPASLHLLHNNPSKKALGSLLDETIRPQVEIPELPDFLRYGGAGPFIAVEARAEWERIGPHLQKLGLISQIDRAALVAYCVAWGRYVYAQRKLTELEDAGLVEKTPSGYKQIGVWLQIANRCSAELRAFLSEFGMSPAARSRVTPSDPQLPLPGVEKPQEGGWGTFPR